jgi:hypothetical protein
MLTPTDDDAVAFLLLELAGGDLGAVDRGPKTASVKE